MASLSPRDRVQIILPVNTQSEKFISDLNLLLQPILHATYSGSVAVFAGRTPTTPVEPLAMIVIDLDPTKRVPVLELCALVCVICERLKLEPVWITGHKVDGFLGSGTRES